MSLSHSPLIVRDGLVLCLDAANPRSYPKSGTTWSDLAGANNGTLTNMENNFDSSNKGSLTFDGGNEYVNGFRPVSGTPDVTYSCWIKLSSLSSYSMFISYYSVSGTEIELRCYQSSGRPEMIVGYSNEYNATAPVGDALSTNVWYFLTGVFDGSSSKIYINDRLSAMDTTSTGTYEGYSGNRDVFIGSRNGSGYFFNGSMSTVMVYYRSLSANEIQQNYLATKGRYE
jgi:hypothetical protein